jgi:ribose 5-phosphate isomerase B
MKIALGADHRGNAAGTQLAEKLRKAGHEVQIVRACSGEVCDYPDQAYAVARAVAQGPAVGGAEAGVLLCGTGIGMAIAANKVPGARAAVVHDELTAQISRSHNNANIVCLSADLLGQRLIEQIVDVWLKTPFDGGRHERRVAKISIIEQGRDPAGA